MKNKKILVTGAAGYIGGTFAFEALKKNYEIIGIDNFINSNKSVFQTLSNYKKFTSYELDLSTESSLLSKIFTDHEPDAIIHFAGLKAVEESEKNQKLYWTNNLVSTLNLLDAAKIKKTDFIFSSSATVYGDTKEQPLSEISTTGTTSAYGSTKLAQEFLISDYSRAYEINSISLRYFNPVGAHSDGIIFENFLDSPNNLMPRIIRVAKNIDQKLYVFGNDYKTKDGTGERDYIHISDLVDGHFAALNEMHNLKGHNIFNLGTGNKTSVKQLIEIFEKVNKIKIPHEYVARREGDVEICYASPSKANKILKWSANKNLEQMCADAWNAVKNESTKFM
jgi:UDP-glucose 4-epimerase